MRAGDILEAKAAPKISRPSAPVTDEAALLARARELDARALAEIHDRYYPELFRYAAFRTDDQAAAQDIASEVFVRLLDTLHVGRAPRTTLRGWLFGVAAHLVADHFRRRPMGPLADTLMAANAPAAEAEENLRRRAVNAALRRLTPEQQNVLALRFGEGSSVEETAAAIGKSVNATKQLQWRAVEALRRLLAVEDVGHA